MDAIFDFYEVVTVLPSTDVPESLWNTEGVILGRAQGDDGLWEYGVMMSVDGNHCWQLKESILESRGRKLRREDLYSGETVKVTVDPKTGTGSES